MADMYRCPEWQTCKESCPYKWVHKKSKGCLGHKNDKVMCPACIPLPSLPEPQPLEPLIKQINDIIYKSKPRHRR